MFIFIYLGPDSVLPSAEQRLHEEGGVNDRKQSEKKVNVRI